MTAHGGLGKLRSYREQAIYVVTQKRNDMAVYEVKPETGNGRSRVLHRNMLLPCSYLPVETHVKSSTSRRTVSRKTDRQQTLQEKAAGSKHGGVADFTPHQLHEFCGVVQDLVERDVGAKRNPSRVDEPDPEWRMVTPMMMTYLSEGHNG